MPGIAIGDFLVLHPPESHCINSVTTEFRPVSGFNSADARIVVCKSYATS